MSKKEKESLESLKHQIRMKATNKALKEVPTFLSLYRLAHHISIIQQYTSSVRTPSGAFVLDSVILQSIGFNLVNKVGQKVFILYFDAYLWDLFRNLPVSYAYVEEKGATGYFVMCFEKSSIATHVTPKFKLAFPILNPQLWTDLKNTNFFTLAKIDKSVTQVGWRPIEWIENSLPIVTQQYIQRLKVSKSSHFIT